MNRDLTVGNPNKVLREFCLPLFASVIFQQLYNIADSFVAGKFINNDALASVGNAYEITLIFLAFGFGINIGCSVIVSQFFGAKRNDEVKTAVYTTFISSGILCITLMVLGYLFCGTLLRAIHTPASLIADSQFYLDIYIYSLPFVFYYNIATGIFTALGDSKTPLYFLACSSIANIGMDILFVAVFNMGVAGVAWATFICQGISSILAIIFVLKRFKKIKSDKKAKAFSFKILLRIMLVAIPSILQQSFVSVGNIIIQSSINSFGASVIAGYSAAVKLNNMVVTSFVTIGNGVSNYTAQNLGAGKTERIKSGFRAGIKLVWIICIPIVLIYFFAGKWLLLLFLEKPTGEAVDTGILFLHILSPFYFFVAAKLVSDGILRGAGKMEKFMIATFVDLLSRVVLSLILSETSLKSTGIWISWPIGWVTATVVSYILYRQYRKTLKSN